ncbi:hypothetical protein ACFPYJ_27025 [Paenibacillus solisilvae]|uniref:Hydrolase n=1 Tax=Paenibacillus solisilvae TaxID=2486751 RepID=A0ABW0W7M4_9BACL
MTNNQDEAFYARKPYYVSVQAGSILEDPTAAAYELVIEVNEEERNQLGELFDELSSMDEAEMIHFAQSPFGSASDEQINRGVDGLLVDIYKLLYKWGTPETKSHIATMGLFSEGSLQ